MIWLRRILAIPLILVFIIVFVPLLVVFRVNDTAGNPRFYIDQLRQANIYNFIVSEALPSAINEMNMDGDNPGNATYISQLKPYLASIAKETVPLEWLQAEAEQGINAAVPYMLGDTESFRITIPLKERVEAGAGAIKNTLHKEGVFPGLYDQTVSVILDEATLGLARLPVSRNDLERVVSTAIPPEWCLTQIDGAISEVTPYFTGEKEHFAIRVDLSNRLDSLEPVAVDILKRQETYNYVFENVLVPVIRQNTQGLTQLPMGLALTDNEIIVTAKAVLPMEWYQALVSDAIKQIFSYLKGAQPSLALVIPLADRKSLAVKALTDLVNKKAGIDVSLLVTPLINGFVNGFVPDQWTLDEASLNQLLGSADSDGLLGQARQWVQKGLTYNDNDLRAGMGTDHKTIDNIRQRIAVGFVVTESELRSLISGGEGDNATASLQDFDEVRRQIGTVRRYLVFAWLIPVLLLFIIGVLGGRSWPGKLIWAASVLGIASLIAFVIFGPVFSAVIQPQLNQALMQPPSASQSFQTLVAGKGISIAEGAIGTFMGGLKIQALVWLAVTILLVVVGVIWQRRKTNGARID